MWPPSDPKAPIATSHLAALFSPSASILGNQNVWVVYNSTLNGTFTFSWQMKRWITNIHATPLDSATHSTSNALCCWSSGLCTTVHSPRVSIYHNAWNEKHSLAGIDHSNQWEVHLKLLIGCLKNKKRITYRSGSCTDQWLLPIASTMINTPRYSYVL